jgi:AraC family transcriptional regulator
MTNAEVILQTVKWVESRLHEDIPVPTAAGKAGYSLHHFIRLFSGVIGVTPGEYIARRKLSEAARELASGGRRVTDVAFDYGFKDLETFTRAFRRQMGATPTAVRRGAPFPYQPPVSSVPSTGGRGTLEEPVTEPLSAFCLVGWSIRVSGQTDAVGKLWARFMERAPSIPGVSIPPRFHQLAWWSEDAEDSIEIMTGVKVHSLVDVPIAMIGKTVPACTCLVFTHRGSMARVGESYRAIYQDWLPCTDKRPSLPFNFERYPAGGIDPYSEAYVMEICVPVM